MSQMLIILDNYNEWSPGAFGHVRSPTPGLSETSLNVGSRRPYIQ